MFQTGYEHGIGDLQRLLLRPGMDRSTLRRAQEGTYAYPHGTVGLRQSDLSFYLQDNYKVNSRLTLNLGLRYENFLGWPWTEVKQGVQLCSLHLDHRIDSGRHNGIPRSGANGQNYNFVPRVGLAYA